MAHKIWTGKEHFLRDPDADKKKYYSMGVVAGIVFIVVVIAMLSGDKQEPVLEEERVLEDELSEYRNMTAEEILNQLNKEKGFEEKIEHPLKEFEMIVESYAFEPNEITVDLNDKVKIMIRSVDVNHSIRIPAFFVDRDIVYGEEAEIEFIAEKAGEFVFNSPEDDNMKGKIIVVDPDEAEESEEAVVEEDAE